MLIKNRESGSLIRLLWLSSNDSPPNFTKHTDNFMFRSAKIVKDIMHTMHVDHTKSFNNLNSWDNTSHSLRPRTRSNNNQFNDDHRSG